MKTRYQKAFDFVALSEEKTAEIRSVLSAVSDKGKETVMMNSKKYWKHPTRAMIAAALAAVLCISAFAFGGRIVYFLTGGSVEQGVDENGVSYTEGSVNFEETVSPIQVDADGKTILVIDGQNKDISNQFSYEEPFIYECTTADGLRHVFVIGGKVGEVGWSEFIWDEDGNPNAGSAMFATPDGRDDAPWLNVGMKELNLPW